MSLSDIFNFILDIFKFIWNLNLLWVLGIIGVLLLIGLVIFIFGLIRDALESFYENNPKYAFYIRWVVAIAILLFFLVGVSGFAISPALIDGSITIDDLYNYLFG